LPKLEHCLGKGAGLNKDTEAEATAETEADSGCEDVDASIKELKAERIRLHSQRKWNDAGAGYVQ